MAAGPLARMIAQVAVMGISILARAIPAAYGAALQNARKGGMDAAKAAGGEAGSIFGGKRMSLDEALLVLNIEVSGSSISSAKDLDPALIQKQYDKYFAANSVENGGSFYLQSKVYRAKEMLDEFMKEKRMEDQQQQRRQNDEK